MATETVDEFRARINQAARDEEEGTPSGGEDWLLGTFRDRGSLHSDFWLGSAADLAERDAIGVFPVGGWWKEKPYLERFDRQARYALIVTIVRRVRTSISSPPLKPRYPSPARSSWYRPRLCSHLMRGARRGRCRLCGCEIAARLRLTEHTGRKSASALWCRRIFAGADKMLTRSGATLPKIAIFWGKSSVLTQQKLTRRNRCQIAGSEGGARLSKHGHIAIGVECPAAIINKADAGGPLGRRTGPRKPKILH